MYSTHEAELDLPSLPLAARRVHIVPALHTSSLLSMGQLCDAGCIVMFDATSVTVQLDNQRILDGTRTPETGLWHLSLVQPSLAPPSVPSDDSEVTTPPPLLHQSFAAVQSATPAELIAFAHASLFSPALSTLDGALSRGYLPQFMGLTAKGLRKHPPQSVAMVKGHLDQSRKTNDPRNSTRHLHLSTPTIPNNSPTSRSHPVNPTMRAHTIVSLLCLSPQPVKSIQIKLENLLWRPAPAITTF